MRTLDLKRVLQYCPNLKFEISKLIDFEIADFKTDTTKHDTHIKQPTQSPKH